MTITPVTLQQLNVLRERLLTSHQAEIIGTTDGQLCGHGVTANYHYDEPNQVLTVDVLHRPFYITLGAIESSLRDALK